MSNYSRRVSSKYPVIKKGEDLKKINVITLMMLILLTMLISSCANRSGAPGACGCQSGCSGNVPQMPALSGPGAFSQ
jgi:hypothetical protein